MAGMENMRNIIKNNNSILILTVVLVLILFSSDLHAENIIIDLDIAIDLALERNESFQIAKEEVRKANAQVIGAASGAFPQITGGLVYMRNWRVPTSVFTFGDQVVSVKLGTEHSYTANLTLTQPIYSGGKTFSALRIAKIYKKYSKENVRQAGQELRVNVYKSFYGAILASELYKVSEQSLDLARENLDVVSKMYAEGVAAEYDLLRARVEVANLKPIVIKTKSNADVAESALKNMLGINSDDSIELAANFDSSYFLMAPIKYEDGINEVMENRPEIKISEYTAQGLKQAISISSSGYRPSLDFSTTLQYQTLFDSGNPMDKKWDRSLNSMLILNVPIFDSWETPSMVKQAKIEYNQSKLQEESIKKSVLLDLEQSIGKYNEARENFSIQGGAVELAERGLSIANLRFENGVGTQLEVSDARLQLNNAKINRANAYYDLAVSYAELLKALGRDIKPMK
jgi:outer membrane protein TolC